MRVTGVSGGCFDNQFNLVFAVSLGLLLFEDIGNLWLTDQVLND